MGVEQNGSHDKPKACASGRPSGKFASRARLSLIQVDGSSHGPGSGLANAYPSRQLQPSKPSVDLR